MSKIQTVVVSETGGPEVLRFQERVLPDPGEGEIQVRLEAVGVNYIDVYYRTGLYPAPLPTGIGLEGAGRVSKVGKGVRDHQEGDAVFFPRGPLGMYAEAINAPATAAFAAPKGLSSETLVAIALKGLTVHYLFRSVHAIQRDEIFVMTAAAGGVGLLASQWARALGARMIGTVSSEIKANLARDNGCAYPVNTSQESLREKVRDLTKGHGVGVVYDSVGAATFEESLDCLRPRGMMVSFGNSSGPVPPFNPGILSQKGSLFFTRPTLMTYMADRGEARERIADLASMVASGAIEPRIHARRPLSEVVAVHQDLEARRTTGSTILLC